MNIGFIRCLYNNFSFFKLSSVTNHSPNGYDLSFAIVDYSFNYHTMRVLNERMI